MTPLGLGASAPAPPTPAAPAKTGRERAATGQDTFAHALRARDATRPAEGDTGTGPAADAEAVGPVSALPASAEDTEDTGGGTDLPVVAPGPAPAEPAPAPWPPAGLGALFGLPGAMGGEDAVSADMAGAPAPRLALQTPHPIPTTTTAAALPSAAPVAPTAIPSMTAPPVDPASIALPDAYAALAADAADPAPEAPPPAFSLPPLPATAATRAPVPLLQSPLPPPDLHGGDFGERFGAQLEWMAEQKIGHARIRVSPQELGPVEVRLRLDGERISADFVSVHVETRQALEQGLPRLRDLLGEHGFHLAHADVGDGRAQHGPAGGGAGTPAHAMATDAEDAAMATTAHRDGIRTSNGLLDAYA